MKILFINNDGGGCADWIEVETGITFRQFFHQRLGASARLEDYHNRVNRDICTADQVLHDGDRVSATAMKIEGACR